jgi:hypothetical protein
MLCTLYVLGYLRVGYAWDAMELWTYLLPLMSALDPVVATVTTPIRLTFTDCEKRAVLTYLLYAHRVLLSYLWEDEE